MAYPPPVLMNVNMLGLFQNAIFLRGITLPDFFSGDPVTLGGVQEPSLACGGVPTLLRLHCELGGVPIVNCTENIPKH